MKKEYVNPNMVRESHPRFRTIEFSSIEQAARFINLYGDLFYIPKDGRWERAKYGFDVSGTCENPTVSFSIEMDNWNIITKGLGLHLQLLYPKKSKVKYWKYIEEIPKQEKTLKDKILELV